MQAREQPRPTIYCPVAFVCPLRRTIRPREFGSHRTCYSFATITLSDCGTICPQLASGTNHMDIRIDKKSDVSVRQQLAEQIIFSIATEKMKPGQALPSVRELARRLKIHHNTVSQAYKDLVRRTWVVRRQGARVVVRSAGERGEQKNGHDVDDLINATIRMALGQPAEGCSLSELAAQPGLAIGALTVAGQYVISEVDRLVPKAVPAISLAF